MIDAKKPLMVAPFPASLSANPYCDLLYDAVSEAGARVAKDASLDPPWLRANRGRVDVIHMHWMSNHYQHWRGDPFSLLTLARFAYRMFLARSLGFRIVWTMHNTAPHDSNSPLSDTLARTLMTRIANVVVHCQHAKSLIQNGRGVNGNVHVIPHGNYIGCYPNHVSKSQARRKLGLPADAKVFLSFGLLRGYKGHDGLKKAFASLKREDAHLVIAGANYDECDSMGRETREQSGNIHMHNRFVPDEEVQYYFNACDYAVFPFERVLTSGSVILSLSFGRPVIVPRLGCLCELDGSGAAILYDPACPAGLHEALSKALEANGEQFAQRARALAKRLDWKHIARRHMAVYRKPAPTLPPRKERL